MYQWKQHSSKHNHIASNHVINVLVSQLIDKQLNKPSETKRIEELKEKLIAAINHCQEAIILDLTYFETMDSVEVDKLIAAIIPFFQQARNFSCAIDSYTLHWGDKHFYKALKITKKTFAAVETLFRTSASLQKTEFSKLRTLDCETLTKLVQALADNSHRVLKQVTFGGRFDFVPLSTAVANLIRTSASLESIDTHWLWIVSLDVFKQIVDAMIKNPQSKIKTFVLGNPTWAIGESIEMLIMLFRNHSSLETIELGSTRYIGDRRGDITTASLLMALAQNQRSVLRELPDFVFLCEHSEQSLKALENLLKTTTSIKVVDLKQGTRARILQAMADNVEGVFEEVTVVLNYPSFRRDFITHKPIVDPSFVALKNFLSASTSIRRVTLFIRANDGRLQELLLAAYSNNPNIEFVLHQSKNNFMYPAEIAHYQKNQSALVQYNASRIGFPMISVIAMASRFYQANKGSQIVESIKPLLPVIRDFLGLGSSSVYDNTLMTTLLRPDLLVSEIMRTVDKQPQALVPKARYSGLSRQALVAQCNKAIKKHPRVVSALMPAGKSEYSINSAEFRVLLKMYDLYQHYVTMASIIREESSPKSSAASKVTKVTNSFSSSSPTDAECKTACETTSSSITPGNIGGASLPTPSAPTATIINSASNPADEERKTVNDQPLATVRAAPQLKDFKEIVKEYLRDQVHIIINDDEKSTLDAILVEYQKYHNISGIQQNHIHWEKLLVPQLNNKRGLANLRFKQFMEALQFAEDKIGPRKKLTSR